MGGGRCRLPWANEEWQLTGADIELVLQRSNALAAGRCVTIWVAAIDNDKLGMIRLRGGSTPSGCFVNAAKAKATPTRDHEVPLDWVDAAT